MCIEVCVVGCAVTGLARTLANEYGAYGITVNNVCPGFTRTDRLGELAERHRSAVGRGGDDPVGGGAFGQPFVQRLQRFEAVG